MVLGSVALRLCGPSTLRLYHPTALQPCGSTALSPYSYFALHLCSSTALGLSVGLWGPSALLLGFRQRLKILIFLPFLGWRSYSCTCNSYIIIIFWRQRGRVVRAPDLKSIGRRFWPLADVVLGSPEFKFSAALVNSQLVCLLPVGILNLVMHACMQHAYVRQQWQSF